jgi:hypothetical protein
LDQSSAVDGPELTDKAFYIHQRVSAAVTVVYK